MSDEVGVVVAGVAGDLLSDPLRFLKRLINASKLNLRDDEPRVLPEKLIHFPDVFPPEESDSGSFR